MIFMGKSMVAGSDFPTNPVKPGMGEDGWFLDCLQLGVSIDGGTPNYHPFLEDFP